MEQVAEGRRRMVWAGVNNPGIGGGWDTLLLCLAAFLLTAVGRVHQLFPVLLPLKPALVTGTMAVAVLLFDTSPARRWEGVRWPATTWLLALAAWMALTVPWALWTGGALGTFLGFGKTVTLYLLIVCAARTTRDVERLALIYFAAAAVFSLVVLMRFHLGEEWRLAKLYYYDANDFATLVVTALPLGLNVALGQTRSLKRGLAWGGIAALAVGFIWSGSRGGFLALLAVMGYVLLRFSTIPRRWRLAAITVICLVAGTVASAQYWSAIRTLAHPEEDYNLTSEEGRVQIWRRGLGYMARYPLLGVGAGNFQTAEGTISPLAERQRRGQGLRWTAPHNSYLQAGAELGVPGLIVFCGFLWSVFAVLRPLRSPGAEGASVSPAGVRMAQALTGSLLGFAIGAFFLTLAYHEMLYTLAGLAVALAKTERLPPVTRLGARPVVRADLHPGEVPG